MTILTKPSNDKKPEKILPLGVVNEDGTLLNPIPSAPSVSICVLMDTQIYFNSFKFNLEQKLLFRKVVFLVLHVIDFPYCDVALL